ncbi:MAG: HAMP domain-containing sensor histidine kinase [bacterium]|nr:HAMP domain-containing sensor histidine kinase [bacterium]
MEQTTKGTFVTPELTVDELSKALYNVTQSLQQSNELLLKSQEQQEEFFSNISHDLRSPIAALRSSVEYLQTYKDLDFNECMQIYAIMMKKITYMEQMINDIFLLSTLETKQRKLHLVDLPIGDFLEDYFFTCKQDPTYNDCDLHFTPPKDLPFLVRIDTALLVRVLNNLFTNAIKYSEGIPYIELSAILYQSDKVLVTVEDHGIGIATENLNRIFDRSYMVSTARSPSAAGNGLGLSIAKSIVQLHDGSIWCKSKQGKGSSFCFTLPINKLKGVENHE